MRRVDLVAVGRAQRREGDRPAARPCRARATMPELGALGAQRLEPGRRRVAGGRLPASCVRSSTSIGRQRAAEAVVHRLGSAGRRRLAQRRERVDDVLAGRGRAPRVVAPAAELDVQVDAGERDAARVDRRAGVDVLLHQDLRGEVGGLRAEDRERAARSPTRAPRRAARWTPRPGSRAGRRAAPLGAPRLALRARSARRRSRAACSEPGSGIARRRVAGLLRRQPGTGTACRASTVVRRLGVVGGAEVLATPCRPLARRSARRARPGARRRRELAAAALAEDRRRRATRSRRRRSPSSRRAPAGGRSRRTRPASWSGRAAPRRCTG